jgi:hypothetical protein
LFHQLADLSLPFACFFLYVIMVCFLLSKSYDMPPCCTKTSLVFFADQIFKTRGVRGLSGLQHSMDDEAAFAASADLDFSMPDEMLDYEEAGQTEPAAYDGSPPSRFVAEATKLSRSCHHTSSLLLLLESAAAAGGHPQASMQQSMIDSLYKRNALQTENALSHNQARAAVASDKLLFACLLDQPYTASAQPILDMHSLSVPA